VTGLRAAALDAIRHGWPVLPGSEWRGAGYRNAINGTSTRQLLPVVPRQYATVEEHQARAWWSTKSHSVLVVTGKTFDVIRVPTIWAIEAAKHTVLREYPAPLILTPIGHAHFVVTVGSSLNDTLRGRREVTLSEPGTVVPLPPTWMAGKQVRWEIRPGASDWQPGDPAKVQQALSATMGWRR
jgi:hypothetical protein